MTGAALDGGAPVANLGGSPARDRKTAHYAAMYDMYLTDPSSRLLSLAFARSTAALLHDATASASPRDALDWVTAPE
jgi:hypothetical protein